MGYGGGSSRTEKETGNERTNVGTTMVSGRMQAEVRSPDDSTDGSGLEKVGEETANRAGRMPFHSMSTRVWPRRAQGGKKRRCAPTVEMVERTYLQRIITTCLAYYRAFRVYIANRIRELIMLPEVFGFGRVRTIEFALYCF